MENYFKDCNKGSKLTLFFYFISFESLMDKYFQIILTTDCKRKTSLKAKVVLLGNLYWHRKEQSQANHLTIGDSHFPERRPKVKPQVVLPGSPWTAIV